MSLLEQSALGKNSGYSSAYDPSLLFPISRKEQRKTIGLCDHLPFTGADLWTGYELSWLNSKGKPMVGIVEFSVPYSSPHLIESKSIKLYLNSLNQTKFHTMYEIQQTIAFDLGRAAGMKIRVKIIKPEVFSKQTISELEGAYIDDLDIKTTQYITDSTLLNAKGTDVEETLCSRLLKSNCPVTGQPDWASVQIRYKGPKIDRQGLLKYLISFRQHSGFHEHCVERIFIDIANRCRPDKLTVYARYTRRGGLDINPFRSNFEDLPVNLRTARQ